MDRRNFLHSAGVGLAALSLPGWVQSCTRGTELRGGDPLLPSGEPSSAAEALAFAKARGRPLLVFVQPDHIGHRYERGALLGVYLNRAMVEQMADLALCDIWCARPDEIRSRLAPGAKVDDATLALLVETQLGFHVLVNGNPTMESESSTYTDTREVEAARAHNQSLYERLHAVIAPNRATLRRRSEEACAMVFPRRSSTSVPNDRTDVTEARLVERVPAYVRWRAEDADPVSRNAWMTMLNDEAVRRWRQSPPPTARWARATGCGAEIEGEAPRGGVDCGMGFTSEYSARFLVFFTEKEG